MPRATAKSRPDSAEPEVLTVRALRLINQGLVGNHWKWSSPADVSRGMTAMQAQDFAGAKRALSLRAGTSGRHPDAVEVDEAIAAGQVVRNRPSRGTLQFSAPEDMHWLTGLMAERSLQGAANRRGDLGVTDEMLAGTTELIDRLLVDGRTISRKDLLGEFAEAGYPGSGGQASHILRHHTESMNIVFAVPDGKQDTFARADDWIEEARVLERETALAELAERYFSTRGPASAADFANWSHLRMGDAREGIRLALDAGDLVEIELAGNSYLVGARSAGADGIGDDEVAEALDTPLLLPPFDEFLIAYKHRNEVIEPSRLAQAIPGRNGMFMPIIVVGGEVVGIWKRALASKSVKIELQPFGRIDKTTRRQLEDAAHDFGNYLGLKTTIA